MEALSGIRGMVLHYIVCCTELGGDVYQRDIEAKFHIRRSSVTSLLQSMEQTGLIARRPVAQDARLKSLVPTDYGTACSKKCYEDLCEFERELQNGISEDEREALFKTLRKLSDNVKNILQQQKGDAEG